MGAATDELFAQSWKQVLTAGIGCDQTSIYVVMSRTSKGTIHLGLTF